MHNKAWGETEILVTTAAILGICSNFEESRRHFSHSSPVISVFSNKGRRFWVRREYRWRFVDVLIGNNSLLHQTVRTINIAPKKRRQILILHYFIFKVRKSFSNASVKILIPQIFTAHAQTYSMDINLKQSSFLPVSRGSDLAWFSLCCNFLAWRE